MNEEHGKGKIDELKGAVKQRIGGASKDRKLEGEGAWDEAKGKVRQGIGDLKDKFKGDKSRRDEP